MLGLAGNARSRVEFKVGHLQLKPWVGDIGEGGQNGAVLYEDEAIRGSGVCCCAKRCA